MNPENLVDGTSGASVDSRVDDAVRIQRLGAKIRALRKERGLTLKVLAQLSGLSHPFLSQVERGLARPSMSSLHQISEALGTNASWLLAGSENTREATVVRASDTSAVPASELGDMDGVRRVVAPETSPFQVVEFSGAPESFREYWVHDGFETIYVISGVVDVDLDGEIFRLEPSDSISYDTRQPHRLRAATQETVKLLMIEASPGFTNVRLR
ncbi:MAG: helix-turn-helix domain-containing protein [Acidimicrobiaceae bacterium]|nr:helix-turn-helix domain-containing protein [Acidimicrobiaceae bacterium]MYB86780.1 helix-turn-helix domain-containing protein [Acidimicrobiaceae bacterium]MYH92649.1 helix-turn-helix domain-containing protein [Acidimicrobiaceae bacterium]